MAVDLITENGNTALYDTVKEVAFGPVFHDWDPDGQSPTAFSNEIAELFLNWIRVDARSLSSRQLERKFNAFMYWIERDGYDAVEESVK